uniref:NADP-dependent oxidoreductase domain-containing protein n=1 Tax=Chromera velia CCMP2878 TaxID=1169474 RepID=A0A0G4HS41_9ALVE|eukprot:Cvel_8200.t1-p1 / transcript=Cvel_8200.t1 / gene=Cvel_8200 / organism=Chromera_velia_CCMP2878 / gene_product=Pyridoxal reductase, chloroplastic, putative / transcript_product=Pyridoxal reductase, chloroplastic, putative / location=Cvel_scaffold447:16095-17917(+) / protein_length=481 / sequence_SO=supercontig / SO=protein_coding / is_pseudo=false
MQGFSLRDAFPLRGALCLLFLLRRAAASGSFFSCFLRPSPHPGILCGGDGRSVLNSETGAAESFYSEAEGRSTSSLSLSQLNKASDASCLSSRRPEATDLRSRRGGILQRFGVGAFGALGVPLLRGFPTAYAGGSLQTGGQMGTVKVGDSLEVSRLGVGTWSWGNKILWGYDESMDGQLQDAFDEIVRGGVNWFDSADSYGTGKITGRAETLLGRFARENRNGRAGENVKVFTKFAPYPFRVGRESMVTAVDEACARLGRSKIEVGQLHWIPPGGWQLREYLDGLAYCVRERGTLGAVGVSNCGPKELKQIAKRLKDLGVPLVSNQVQFSLVSRLPETSGLLNECADMGIRLIGYSPLCLGLLTGKFSQQPAEPKQSLPSGLRSVVFPSLLSKTEGLQATLREISAAQSKKTGVSVTPAAVAISWVLSKDVLCLVGVKNANQSVENLKAAGLKLDEGELRALDDESRGLGNLAQQNIFQTA